MLAFNCSTPQEVTKALELTVKSQIVPANVQLGVYHNGFITLESGNKENRDWADYGRDDLEDTRN
eukprot:TRINITY_DN14740_c0_g1_i1.p1 TRINITY_DN14740_c0_g1~~TRINITY_DN14740_c0_g1_i1.p1  ORF type:complete len:65 (-),score=4.68 TRINITY_DN14740_c0_g1_i1:208-402(-)